MVLRLVFAALAVVLVILLVFFQVRTSHRLETWTYVPVGSAGVLEVGGQDIVSLLPVLSVSGTAAHDVTRHGDSYLRLDSKRVDGLGLDIRTVSADYQLLAATGGGSQGSLLLAPYPRLIATVQFDPSGATTATTEFTFPIAEAEVLAVFPRDEARIAFDKTRVVVKMRGSEAPSGLLVLFKGLPVVVELQLTPAETRAHLNQLILEW